MGERLLRPGIRNSDRIAMMVRDVGWIGHAFFTSLLTLIDDFGRYDARPAILRTECFPLLLDLVRETDVQRCLAACEKAGLVRLYTDDAKPFLEVLRFRQRLRATKSKWPDPPSSAGHCPDNVMTMTIQTETKTDTDTEANTETETETETARVGGADAAADVGVPGSGPIVSRLLDETGIATNGNRFVRSDCAELIRVAGFERAKWAIQSGLGRGFGARRAVKYALGIITNQAADADANSPQKPGQGFKRREPTAEDIS